MNNLEQKIADLRNTIISRRAECRRSAAVSAAVYCVLLLVVIGYTSFIYFSLKEVMTVDSLSMLLTEQIRSRMPDALGTIRGELKPWGEKLGKNAVDTALEAIPQGGAMFRAMLKEQTSAMVSYAEKEQLPRLYRQLDAAVGEAVKSHKELKTGNFAMTFPQLASDCVSAELSKIIDTEFFRGVSSLESQLKYLRGTPNARLRKREHSEKMFILYWLYICDQSKLENQGNSLGRLVGVMDSSAESFAEKLREAAK